MSSKEALHGILKELSLTDLRVAKRYLEVSVKVRLTAPSESLELGYLQQLVDSLPDEKVCSAGFYLDKLRSMGDPTVEMLLDQEEAEGEAKGSVMELFFSEHYPDLVPKLRTSEGRIALESVKDVMIGVGSRPIAENIPDILTKLGTAYVGAASDESVRQNHTTV